MDSRPELTAKTKLCDFRDFYWLKEELIKFCRENNLDTSGSKLEITERIEQFLETGVKATAVRARSFSTTSSFKWNTEQLTLQTIITDNYTNTENVRKFFTQEIGDRFKFNVKFMNWMKSNPGKTLSDAVKEWLRIEQEKRLGKSKGEIAPQFEYNRYIRDFCSDNPGASKNLAIECWKAKKSLRGNNQYNKSDLDLVADTSTG